MIHRGKGKGYICVFGEGGKFSLTFIFTNYIVHYFTRGSFNFCSFWCFELITCMICYFRRLSARVSFSIVVELQNLILHKVADNCSLKSQLLSCCSRVDMKNHDFAVTIGLTFF